ncbi:SRPBCC family protein [Marinicellulosiphila megalodicopiae]|uniref:SRPBCC family protein n=1 Tax=Marinicellulosiphila megalodicopiae TaxID=2724896 RepID=UPI003BB11987
MKMKTSIMIDAPIDVIWQKITDIEHCADTITGIMNVEVLERPESGLVGFKWRETRKMFGKEADETMWITHSEENHFYQTRAENSGAVYISVMKVQKKGTLVELSMEFSGEAQTFIAKILSFIFTPLMKKSMVKLIQQDLEDIKRSVESR